MPQIELMNNDVIFKNIDATIHKWAEGNYKPGSGTCKVHKHALHVIARELLYCWNALKLDN